MGLEEDFQHAVDAVRQVDRSSVSSEQLLTLYGLYKQATQADVGTPAPSSLDAKAWAKWQAWSRLRGTDPASAKQKYVDAASAVLEAQGSKAE